MSTYCSLCEICVSVSIDSLPRNNFYTCLTCDPSVQAHDSIDRLAEKKECACDLMLVTSVSLEEGVIAYRSASEDASMVWFTDDSTVSCVAVSLRSFVQVLLTQWSIPTESTLWATSTVVSFASKTVSRRSHSLPMTGHFPEGTATRGTTAILPVVPPTGF